MAQTPLRHWLARTPCPRAIRCVLPEGEPVTIAIGATRKRWSDAESAVPPDASRVEALDASGAVLRAYSLADGDDAPRERPAAPPAAMIPATPIELARIVLDATDAGAKRHAAAYEATMGELVGLVRVIAEQHAAAQRRLAALEHAHARMIRRVAAEVDEPADDATGLDAMMGPLLAAAFLPAPAPAPNGKKGKGVPE